MATLAAGKGYWSGEFSSSLTYDNNIFCLSPEDMEQFRHSQNPARFPYQTADDIDVVFKGELRWQKAGSKMAAKLGVKAHQFVVNQEKSYGVVNAGWKRELGSVGKLGLFYIWVPNYFLRYYQSRTSWDTARYVACRFGEHLLGFNFEREFGPVKVQPGYRFEVDDYNREFGYCDTRAHWWTGRVKRQPRANLGVRWEYEFKIAQAKGPVPDISYHQHKVSLNIASRPRSFNRFGVEVGYSFGYRNYTTAVDPAHFGRVDQTQEVTVGCDYRLMPVTVVFEYHLKWRDVTSPYQKEIEEIKEYRKKYFSLGITLPIKQEGGTKKRQRERGAEVRRFFEFAYFLLSLIIITCIKPLPVSQKFVVINMVKTRGYLHDIAVQGGRAYVADGQAGLAVFDITTPEAPVF